MTRPALSIIIPIYNTEQYLGECLDSVLSQDLKSFEVICINDGSTDNSRAILQEYKNNFPDIIIIDKENEGLSAARNSGTNQARGEYIYYLDSDDYLLPNMLYRMYDFASTNELDIACFNSTVHSNGSSYFASKVVLTEILPGEAYYAHYYKNNGFFPVSPVWMYLYKRSYLFAADLGFIKGRIHEDEQFTPRAFLKASRVLLSDIPVLMHRVNRPDSIATGYKRKNQVDRISNCRELYPIFANLEKNQSIFLHSLFNIYNSVAKAIISNDITFRENLFTADVYRTWKTCISNRDYFLDYFLFKNLPKTYRRYIRKSHSRFNQRWMKGCSRILFYLFSNV